MASPIFAGNGPGQVSLRPGQVWVSGGGRGMDSAVNPPVYTRPQAPYDRLSAVTEYIAAAIFPLTPVYIHIEDAEKHTSLRVVYSTPGVEIAETRTGPLNEIMTELAAVRALEMK